MQLGLVWTALSQREHHATEHISSTGIFFWLGMEGPGKGCQQKDKVSQHWPPFRKTQRRKFILYRKRHNTLTFSSGRIEMMGYFCRGSCSG